MFTLQIHMDGKLVHRQEVSRKSEVWAAMEQNPPKQAKGGVVSLLDGLRREHIAISCHGTHGPRWGLL